MSAIFDEPLVWVVVIWLLLILHDWVSASADEKREYTRLLRLENDKLENDT